MNKTIMTLSAIAAGSALALTACGTSAPASAGHTAPSVPASRAASHAPSASVTGKQLTAAGLAARLLADGLPLTGLIVYNAVTDPNHLMGRNGGYTSKVAWADPRALAAGQVTVADDPGGVENGGGIEVFPAMAGAQARYSEMSGLTPPLGDGYDYLAGAALLRLSQYLTPAQAQVYRKASQQQ